MICCGEKRLHEEWRIHRAGKMVKKERETRQATEELLQEYPDLKAFLESKKNDAKHTTFRLGIENNDTLQELSCRL